MAFTSRFLRTLLIALASVGVGGGAFAACSNQGEGEFCDRFGDNGGNDECQSGLECTPVGSLNGQGGQTAAPTTGSGTDNSHLGRCCPPLAQRPNATTVICQLSPNPGGGDAAVPLETGVPSQDAAGDASTDASGTDARGTDASGDASADAADAGG